MRYATIVAVALLLFLAGCTSGTGPTTTPSPIGNVDTRGLELFEERVVGANPGCVTCHSLDEGITLVGPSLFGVGSRVQGTSDADYIRQSIVDPDAYVVDGFVRGQMNSGWDDYLSDEQIESLVALLLES
jgi:mono/diheme cytochrome c family protein